MTTSKKSKSVQQVEPEEKEPTSVAGLCLKIALGTP